jgi:hypothetical protein
MATHLELDRRLRFSAIPLDFACRSARRGGELSVGPRDAPSRL